MGLGYQVDTATDLKECLDKLRRAVPDVLVLDLELRAGEAGQILHRLREEREFAGIRVAVVASVVPICFLHQLLVSPMIRYFAKPLRSEGLRDWIDSFRTDSHATTPQNKVKTIRPRTKDRSAEEPARNELDDNSHNRVLETVGKQNGRNAARSASKKGMRDSTRHRLHPVSHQ
jgi:CheY-like chemotaxis protein